MNTMWKTLGSLMLLGGMMWGTGCDEKKAETPEATPEAPVVATDGEAKPDEVKGADTITVTAEGAKIDPAVAKSMIPAGAYYCDMGTVHYARMDKGDGKCPECGMMLTQMPGEGASKDAGGAVAEKTACGCASGDKKCESCEKAGEACKCGSGEACEHCESCDGGKVAEGGDHACDHASGEACDCAHGDKKEKHDHAGHDHEGHGH
jgi:hypothetical protein